MCFPFKLKRFGGATKEDKNYIQEGRRALLFCVRKGDDSIFHWKNDNDDETNKSIMMMQR